MGTKQQFVTLALAEVNRFNIRLILMRKPKL